MDNPIMLILVLGAVVLTGFGLAQNADGQGVEAKKTIGMACVLVSIVFISIIVANIVRLIRWVC